MIWSIGGISVDFRPNKSGSDQALCDKDCRVNLAMQIIKNEMSKVFRNVGVW